MKQFSNYNLYLYTEYFLSDTAEKEVGKMVKKHGGSKVLLVYDATVKLLSLDKTVQEALTADGVPYVMMPEGVLPNGRRSLMEKGVALAKKEGVDFVVAMGGGSTIDTAKLIAQGICYDGDPWDLVTGKGKISTNAKVGTIPTIAASGSESSRASAVVDDIETGLKKGNGFPNNRPVFCLQNPKLTMSVPAFHTACGAADAFGHTFNRFFYPSYSSLADWISAGILHNILKFGPIAVKDPGNYEARRELLMSAAFAHNDITEVGHSGPHGGAHDLCNYLCNEYDAPHGVNVAMSFAPWLEFVAEKGNEQNVMDAANFAVKVLDVPADYYDPKGVAMEGARRIRDWVKSLGLPTTFSEYFKMIGKDIDPASISEDDLLKYAEFNSKGVTSGYIDMTREDHLYTLAKIVK